MYNTTVGSGYVGDDDSCDHPHYGSDIYLDAHRDFVQNLL
jgi:hypothetical protein